MDRAYAEIIALGGTHEQAMAAKQAVYDTSHEHWKKHSMTLAGLSIRHNIQMETHGGTIGKLAGVGAALITPIFPPAGIALGITGAGFSAHSRLLEGYTESLEVKQAWQRNILQANGNMDEATRLMIEQGYLPPGDPENPDPHPQIVAAKPEKARDRFKEVTLGGSAVYASTLV